MDIMENKTITVKTTVKKPVATVWNHWVEPAHITKWCQANDEWHAPLAENDLRVGGKFKTRMEAKDGSFGFDFGGEYTTVVQHKTIEYVMDDGRKVKITFEEKGSETNIIESFDPEETNSPELQRDGWQAIINNFKKYSEANS